MKKSCDGKLDLRVAFVGYRDHDFAERFVIKDFDDDIEKVKKFINDVKCLSG